MPTCNREVAVCGMRRLCGSTPLRSYKVQRVAFRLSSYMLCACHQHSETPTIEITGPRCSKVSCLLNSLGGGSKMAPTVEGEHKMADSTFSIK